MNRTIAAALFALAAMFSTPGFAADTIRIDNAQARAMLPGAKVGGGYLAITNTGPQNDTLVSVTSPRASSVQLHQMSIDNGIMIMRELRDGIEIPAGKTILFKPGAYHLMFMDVREPFKRGETITATLTFAKAGAVEVAFAVGSAGGDMSAPAAGAEQAGDDHAMPGMDMGKTDMGGMDMPGMSMDPKQQIRQTMRKQFETPEKPLTTDPIIVRNDWAIAAWQQDGRGGRVLLRKGPHGFEALLCSGDSLKDPAVLQTLGVDAADAKALTDQLATAEHSLDPTTVALFASFVGTVMLDKAASGHADHAGHSK